MLLESGIGITVGRRALIAGLLWWLAATAVVALGLGFALVYVFACSQGTDDCSETEVLAVLTAGVGVSFLPLWPATAYLFKWRTRGRVTAGRRAPMLAGLLMLYAPIGCLAVGYGVGPVDNQALEGVAWIGLALSWLAFGLWLVSAVATRAVNGKATAGRGPDA